MKAGALIKQPPPPRVDLNMALTAGPLIAPPGLIELLQPAWLCARPLCLQIGMLNRCCQMITPTSTKSLSIMLLAKCLAELMRPHWSQLPLFVFFFFFLSQDRCCTDGRHRRWGGKVRKGKRQKGGNTGLENERKREGKQRGWRQRRGEQGWCDWERKRKWMIRWMVAKVFTTVSEVWFYLVSVWRVSMCDDACMAWVELESGIKKINYQAMDIWN